MKTKRITQKDQMLLNEAARRMTQFKHDANSEFLGLGTPSEYKSEYFTASFGRELPRVSNWYKLTPKGKEYFAKAIVTQS